MRQATSLNDDEAYDTIKIAILPQDPRCREQKYARINLRSQDPESASRHASSIGDSRRGARCDYDKVLYTSAWRRLAGVTQVISPEHEEIPLHNRMTHSDKVASVAWAIASNIVSSPNEELKIIVAQLGGIDLDMVATAALAHDLGHAPFGHVGEQELDRWGKQHGIIDGFEGNAQTFRIVTRLARWRRHNPGLRLRLGTLSAIAKYPWVRGANVLDLTSLPEKRSKRNRELEARLRALSAQERHKYWDKYGAYYSEELLLRQARSWMPQPFIDGELVLSQSLEASIMDCADDIAYAVHDLEDFAASNFLDFDHLASTCTRWYQKHSLEETPDEQKVADNWCSRVRSKLERDYPERFNSEDYAEAVKWLGIELREITTTTDDISRLKGMWETIQARRTSTFIANFVDPNEFAITENPEWENGPLLRMKSRTWHRVNLLKALIMDFVVNAPLVSAHQISARAVIRDLADSLYEWIRSAERSSGKRMTGLPALRV